MIKSEKLRKYMLSRFLWVIFIIGLVEVVLTSIIRTTVAPFLESTLMLEGKITTMHLNTMLLEMIKGIGFVLLQRVGNTYSVIADSFLGKLLENILGSNEFEKMEEISRQMADNDGSSLIWRLVIFALLIVVVWILPYIIGALSYSKMVTKKVKELDKERNDKEQEFIRQRNLLLSDVAHDIKTPITTVAGFSKALADGTVAEDEKQKYLNSVYIKSMQISDLVSLLFEYVKMDSTGYVLNKTKVDICELVRNCVARVYTDFEQQEMEVDIDIPDEKIFVNADKMQMERAIGNLLNNTIKHNPKGTKVFVSLKCDASAYGSTTGRVRGRVYIEIADNGVLIESEIAKHLFDPFVQGDASRTSGSGSGLGLSITSKIVEMHGGSIVLKQYKNSDEDCKIKSFNITL